MHHATLSEMTPLRRAMEYVARFFVFYSIVVYFIELELAGHTPSQGFWLLNERLIAVAFTTEYVIRWLASDNKRHYPFKFLSVVDLISILPFYAGFFTPEESLGAVRALRILRLFKLVRYSPALCNVLGSLKKVKSELLVVGYVVIMVVLFSSALIYQFEKDVQPDKYGKPSDALWWSFVTLATVGYGDLAPMTFWGRLVAVGTMIIGIGIFGVFVSLIGSAFLSTMREEGKHDERETERALQQPPPEQEPSQRPPLPKATQVGTRRNRRQK